MTFCLHVPTVTLGFALGMALGIALGSRWKHVLYFLAYGAWPTAEDVFMWKR